MTTPNSGRHRIARLDLPEGFGGFIEVKEDARGRYLRWVPSGDPADGGICWWQDNSRITLGSARKWDTVTGKRRQRDGHWMEIQRTPIGQEVGDPARTAKRNGADESD